LTQEIAAIEALVLEHVHHLGIVLNLGGSTAEVTLKEKVSSVRLSDQLFLFHRNLELNVS